MKITLPACSSLSHPGKGGKQKPNLSILDRQTKIVTTNC